MEDGNIKKTKYSKKIVITAIIAIVLFWITESVLVYFGGEGYPDRFVTCWFTFWGVELAALAGIKITETRHPEAEEDEEAVG